MYWTNGWCTVSFWRKPSGIMSIGNQGRFMPNLISESDSYLAPSLLKHLIARSNTAQAAMSWQNSNLVVSSIFSTKFDPFGKMHTQQISKSCLAERWSSTFVLSPPFYGTKILDSHQFLLCQICCNFHSGTADAFFTVVCDKRNQSHAQLFFEISI